MKISFAYGMLLSLLLFLTGNMSHAQRTVRDYSKTIKYQGLGNDSILAAFSERFIILDSLINSAITVEDELAGVPSFSTHRLDSLYDAKKSQESRAFKRKSGLELTGQAYQRLDNTLGFDEDNDQYSSYSTKIQAELGWNLFNSSFLQRKSELKLIGLTNRHEYLQQQKELSLPVWDETIDRIERKYDRLAVVVLQEQLRNAEVLGMAYQFVLEQDRTGNEKLLDVMNERMRLEHALAQMGGLAQAEEQAVKGIIKNIHPVVIKVDSTQLFNLMYENNVDLQILRTSEEMLETRKRLTNYAHEMRLTPFVRVSHYLRSHLPSSTNVEVGARFTLPLYDDSSAKRKALQTQQVLTGLDRQHVSESILEKSRRIIRQIDRLNDAITAEHRHRVQLYRFIAIRKDAYLKSLNGYNHIARLEEYNEYLKSLERMIGLLRIRSLSILNLQKATGCTELTGIILTKEISE